MSSTMAKDSIVGDDWIRQTMQAVPIQRIVDPATGQFAGDILTGPVRLAFCDSLWELPAPTPQTQNPKHGATILFPTGQDFSILHEEYYKICGQVFPEYYVNGQYHGLQSPFRDQAEKIKFTGFTPGAVFMTCTSKYKPPIVDTRYNPIVDRNKVYSGVWAICAIRAYSYGKNPPQPKKGVAFGLQSVMIIGDDTKLAGGGPDVTKQMAGVAGKINAPVVRPGIAAGMPMAGAPAPAPAAAIPGYTAVGGGVPQATVPQTHYQPQPSASGYTPEQEAEMRAMGLL